ncbi:hypothetical protein [Streptomyces sp. NBC_00893]|uniref:hypothetical protein n=1 Tax=Streptomyces sp. NBC_00893 TaxID=2975862 RepID=UPI00225B0F74|nr:hypothetical protein [Streptomyces sp. NBC_00893]MCX4849687.1 hypothetical protein [Streptomyces sp. NBC_00893]
MSREQSPAAVIRGRGQVLHSGGHTVASGDPRLRTVATGPLTAPPVGAPIDATPRADGGRTAAGACPERSGSVSA